MSDNLDTGEDMFDVVVAGDHSNVKKFIFLAKTSKIIESDDIHFF